MERLPGGNSEDLKELDAVIPPEIANGVEKFREVFRIATWDELRQLVDKLAAAPVKTIQRPPFTGIADAMWAERTLH